MKSDSRSDRTSIPPRPLPFVLAASEQGTLIVNRLDYRMTSATSGYGVGHQILNTARCEGEEVNFAVQMLAMLREIRGNGVIALDCGANIGVHCIEWSRHMTGWGAVTAFEAQERIYYALAGNIALNNCFNARAVHAALSDSDGEIAMPRPDYTQPGSFGSLEIRPGPKVENIGQAISYRPEDLQNVRALRIDSLALGRADFIKIDVEGMEISVLRGAEETIRRCRPIMLIEFVKSDRAQLEEFFRRHSYTFLYSGVNVLAMHEDDPVLPGVRIVGGDA